MGDYWWEPWLDFLFGKVIMPLLLMGLSLFILALPFGIYGCIRQENSPKFSLFKNEWSCSQYHDYTTTTLIMSGKVLVPVITAHHDCIDWRHNGY